MKHEETVLKPEIEENEAFEKIEPMLEEASLDLGADEFKTFRKVI